MRTHDRAKDSQRGAIQAGRFSAKEIERNDDQADSDQKRPGHFEPPQIQNDRHQADAEAVRDFTRQMNVASLFQSLVLHKCRQMTLFTDFSVGSSLTIKR